MATHAHDHLQNALSIVISIALAFVVGYSLLRPVAAAGVPVRRAITVNRLMSGNCSLHEQSK
jgi:hypothetical protein